MKWTKKVGDPIKKGDVVADVETDKAVMEVEAFHDGYLSGPLAAEGTEAPVGQIIGYIAESVKDVAAAAPDRPGACAAACRAAETGKAPDAANRQPAKAPLRHRFRQFWRRRWDQYARPFRAVAAGRNTVRRRAPEHRTPAAPAAKGGRACSGRPAL